MKQGMFIVQIPLSKRNEDIPGVVSKVYTQLSELQKHFCVELVECAFKTNLKNKILSRLPFFPNMFKWPDSRPYPYDMDFLYCRVEECDGEIVRFFKRIKEKNPNCKIIVEFPTYPLDYHSMIKRVKHLSMIPTMIKHKSAMKRIDRYVDCFVDFEQIDVDSKVPTIRIDNMLNYSKVTKRIIFPGTETINAISVSSMMWWHRIDRIINGLHDYYSNGGERNIVLHLVGTGPQLKRIQKLVKKYNLKEHVHYYGVKTGVDLDEIYNKCDIAVEVLAEKEFFSSSLKSREYWGKGLPIVATSTFEPGVKEISDYIFHPGYGNKPVNINSLIKYFDGLYGAGSITEKEIISDYIRQFACRRYDITNAFMPVVNYIDK